MRRSVLAVDRLASFVAGLVLLALGLAAAAWGAHQLTRVWPAAPDRLHLKTATDAFGQSWWPSASAIAGFVLLVLAVWWLVAHLPHRGADPLRLPGSNRTGALTVDGSSAADAAGEVLADLPGVRSASGRLVHERGRLIAVLDVTAEPSTDLAELSAELDRTSADLASVLGRDDVTCRVRVHVARSARRPSRVS